jgi:hypothetical protein
MNRVPLVVFMAPEREHLEKAFDMLEAFAHGNWAGMRARVSGLSEEEFATVIAELVDEGYFEEVGVFRPLGRRSPVIVHSDRTRLSGRGKRLVGLWVEDGTVEGIATADLTRAPGPCVVCQTTENVRSIFRSRPWLQATHEDGTGEVRKLPPVDLCDTHRMPAALEDIVIGWCENEGCRRWGVEGRRSPCGQPYQVFPEAT